MESIAERVAKLEGQFKDASLDVNAITLKDDIVRLREDMLSLYKFIEDAIGVRDVGLVKRLRTKKVNPSVQDLNPQPR